MLLTLLYHQISHSKYGNPLPLFEKHLSYIANRYRTVHPGDTVPVNKLSVCLTFDDATFDFYALIFPLLQKYQLKAVLAVPTAFIPHHITHTEEERLKLLSEYKQPNTSASSPAFCSWDELRFLSDSPLIEIASHSVNHLPFNKEIVDIEYELYASKLVLKEMLKKTPKTFVYPFGRFTIACHARAKKHYPFIMRIGSALNIDWYNRNQIIYRVNADNLQYDKSPFLIRKYLRYFFGFFLNTIRKK